MPHLDPTDLSRFTDGSLPPERAVEIQAHLDGCVLCQDQLEQCQSDGEFLRQFAPLGQMETDPFPAAIDARLLPELASRLSPPSGASGRAKFAPNTKPSHPEAPPIANYVLLHKLGTGAFGVVWDAEDQLRHRCAVKVLDQRNADYDLAGIRKSKQLKLPGLVAIWHVGQTDDGGWYYVMDLVARTLAADLHRRGKFPAPEARAVIAELLAALAGCHQAGLAHRDIKPENIGFTETDRLVLLDLGLVTEARRTNRTLVGTPDYMPHKPSATADLDDLYAAGMILYCLLTGEKPVAPLPAKPVGLAPLRGLELQLYRAARKATASLASERFTSATGFLKAVRPIPRTPRAKPRPAAEPATTPAQLGRQLGQFIAPVVTQVAEGIEAALKQTSARFRDSEPAEQSPAATDGKTSASQPIQDAANKLFRGAGAAFAKIKIKSRIRKAGSHGIIIEPTAGAETNPATNQTNRMQTSTQNTKELLTQAATVFGDIGQTQRLQLIRLETEKLGRPRYKIVIVGQFKSGKSWLINHVFLREKLLFSDLMEATAVPTEIEHRAQKLLEVHPRRVQTETLAVGEGTEANSLQFQVGLEAGTPALTPNPTPDDIKRATTADDAAGRARLARETALVRLGWPAPALGGYTIVDTPGINSTNEAVAETTYRVIPEADVAVFITPARQLDQTDLAFLRGRVFGEGLSRCLVTVNHNSRTANLNDGQLQDIVRHVGAQLQTIGRPNVPVELVNLGGQPEHEASLAQFADKLQQFLAANVLPGRVERARNILRRELHSARLECEVQLAALQKSPAEKQSVLKKLQAESRELERRYNQLLDALIVDLKSIYDDHLKGLMLGIDRIREGYLGHLKACDGLTDMQKLMERAPSLLKAPSEDLFFNAALDTRKRVQQLEAKYNASFRDATAPWGQAITSELGIGNDLVTKALKNTPYPVLFLLDVALSDWLMPGGIIWGTIWRFVGSKLPVIRDLLPSKLVKSALLAWVEREVTKQFELTKSSVREEAATVFHKVESSVRDAWVEHLSAQTNNITGTVEATLDAPKNAARDETLRSGIRNIDELICQLG